MDLNSSTNPSEPSHIHVPRPSRAEEPGAPASRGLDPDLSAALATCVTCGVVEDGR